MVRSGLGVEFPVRKSKVRERARRPRGECPHRMPDLSRMAAGWWSEGLTTPEAVRAAGELPPGDLPYPHRPGGHRCCVQSKARREARQALEAFSVATDAARVESERQAWDRLVEAGEVEPWDEPADLSARALERWQRETSRLYEARESSLRKAWNLAGAEKLEAECDAIVDNLVARSLPREGTYQGELGILKRRARSGAYGAEDELQGELDDLRQRFEVGSVRPLVGEWFGWSGAELRQAEKFSAGEKRAR